MAPYEPGDPVPNEKTLEIALQSRVEVPYELYESVFSGESGIRTHGTLLGHTRFPSVLLKPLGHLSGYWYS